MPRRHRLDANHATIKAALHAYGWATSDGSQGQQKGAPDLWASRHGRTVAVEIKQPGQPLRQSQVDWLELWQGESAVLSIVEDVARLTADGVCYQWTPERGTQHLMDILKK